MEVAQGRFEVTIGPARSDKRSAKGGAPFDVSEVRSCLPAATRFRSTAQLRGGAFTEHDLVQGYDTARDRKRLTTLDPEVPLNVKAYGTAIDGQYHDDRGGSQ